MNANSNKINKYSDQNKLFEILDLVSKSSCPHALIFGGPKGIGKATAAKELANNLLAQPSDLSHNLLWVSSLAGHIAIEQIRAIRDFFSQTSSNDLYRIVIIDSADDLSEKSANALLKILEEPPAKSLLILIAHQPHSLIATIKSRCSMIKFRPPESAHDIVQAQLRASPTEIGLLLRLAHNIPGIALSLGQNQALEIYDKMISVLDSSSYAQSYKFIEEYFTDGSAEKWWLFSYLIQYLAEKIVRIASLSHHDSALFASERKLVDELAASKARQDWIITYDKILQLDESTKKLYLDHRSSAIAMLALLKE